MSGLEDSQTTLVDKAQTRSMFLVVIEPYDRWWAVTMELLEEGRSG